MRASRALSYEGRDRGADLVDCSVLVPDSGGKGHKWTYRNLDIAAFATAIAKPHGVKVLVQSGLLLSRDPLLTAHPGESGLEAIKRAAGSAGVLVVSDGDGGILITRAGTARAASLVEGENIMAGKVTYDATDRFHSYLISSQPPGTDEASARPRACRPGHGRRHARTNRVLVIRPDKGYNAAGRAAARGLGSSHPRRARGHCHHRAGLDAAERQALAGQRDHARASRRGCSASTATC
jgi:hypothetical protein